MSHPDATVVLPVPMFFWAGRNKGIHAFWSIDVALKGSRCEARPQWRPPEALARRQWQPAMAP
jgi:hypothetical protein